MMICVSKMFKGFLFIGKCLYMYLQISEFVILKKKKKKCVLFFFFLQNYQFIMYQNCILQEYCFTWIFLVDVCYKNFKYMYNRKLNIGEKVCCISIFSYQKCKYSSVCVNFTWNILNETYLRQNFIY